MTKWALGITGGIGSGKSTVVHLFKEKGIQTIDADDVARLVVAKGSSALAKITSHFGNEILLPDGTLNRTALRQRIFSTQTQRQWLEQLLHPLIQQQIIQFFSHVTSAYAILASPLLIETNQTSLVNRILVVDSSEEKQIERSMKRDQNTQQQIKAIMQNQLSRDERLRYANDIINNNDSIDELALQVDRLHQQYLTLSEQTIL